MTAVIAAVLAAAATALWLWNPAESRLRALMPREDAADSDGPAALAKRLLRRFRKDEDAAEKHTAAAIAVIDRASELLRVGAAPTAVLTHLSKLPGPADLQEALSKAARAAELGAAPHQAISAHSDGLPRQSAEILAGMASVWFVAESAGAPAADLLQRFAATARMQADAARERGIALAGPQSTVRVLTALPLLSLGLALLIGADLGKLLSSAPGAAACAGGAVLLVLGRLWMRHMLGKAQ